MFASFVSFLSWVEGTALALWVGESLWGFPISLTLHALGMGFLAGGNVLIGLRLLGVAPGVPLPALLRLYPFLWACAALSLISGIMLLSAYPAKALTNEVFYFKLSLIGVGLWALAGPVRRMLAQSQRHAGFGALMLFVWLATITAGRFLAYTHHVMHAIELGGG